MSKATEDTKTALEIIQNYDIDSLPRVRELGNQP